jgi:phosphoribosylformimino-5-aminoimidazole carboxamide ribonucleotide (ProFAR) isomerase
VIDLDAAIGSGANDSLVELLASRARCRVGGGVRSIARARALVDQGAHKVIVGTAAFTTAGVNTNLLGELSREIGRGRLVVAVDSKGGRIVIKGWRQATLLSAEQVLQSLEPYCSGFLCTYVDKEGMLQGTDLEWFRRLRTATSLELTAAGGITTIAEVQALIGMDIHAALGMAVYTGRLTLDELAKLNGC